MRKTVKLDTYIRVKEFFKKNKNKEFPATQIRNELKIDYESLLFILDTLIKEGAISVKDGKYGGIK